MRKSTALLAVFVVAVVAVIALLENHQSAAQQPPNARAGVRFAPWEYKTIRPDLTLEMRGDAKSELNALGEDGWELCESVRTEGMPFLIFKRTSGRGRSGR